MKIVHIGHSQGAPTAASSLLLALKPRTVEQPLSLNLCWAPDTGGKAFQDMVGLNPSEVPPTIAVKFLGAGTAACFADLLTFPLDTAKVRLQVPGGQPLVVSVHTQPLSTTYLPGPSSHSVPQIQGEKQASQAAPSVQYRGVLGTILTMVRTEGPRSPYNGLVAGLQRQMSFASIRIGLYDSVKHLLLALKPRTVEQPLSLNLCWAPDTGGKAFQDMVGLNPSEVPPTIAVKFLGAGTAACFADLLTFPLDTAKVRLQVPGGQPLVVSVHTQPLSTTYLPGPSSHSVPQIQGEKQASQAAPSVQYRGVLGTILTMVRTEGPRSPYNGLVAGLQRQMSFASIRIGLYDSVKQFYTPKGADNTSVTTRILAGCTTGAMAVTCAQPTDVVKVRFQASVQLGPGSDRKYSGTMDAYRTIAREEGVRGLWKGTWPNITRNAIVNCAEMVTYDIVKEKLLDNHLLTDNFPCHFVSAFGAGFCATVVASPVDVVKTRYMNSSPGRYRSPLDCMLKMVAHEGPTAFYKGFTPSFLRLGSWNVMMFVTYEQLKRALMKVQMLRESPF
ncbi:Mitochondrial uncoupling protein 3 [Tupaia chinensis]|uniref:Mitochondrial uncoupling protein 3 n=1 Tax=Tupaia chinensis TaxID=246437 RepID=L9LB22_TUPCH|nr:Mitochondrial uncoupling protein 3 [Tupaia chinensis]